MTITADASRRLFVALPVPEDIRAALTTAIAALSPPSGPGLRWVRPEAMHLTLTFLGAVEVRRVADLETRLARAASRCVPLALELGATGRFGQRVLWVGIAGDRDRLVRLAAATSAAARRAGIAVEDRPYRPHLTLARNDGALDLRAVVAAIGTVAGSWSATELQLVESHLGKGVGGSAKHEVMARWPLGGSPAG